MEAMNVKADLLTQGLWRFNFLPQDRRSIIDNELFKAFQS
jgi:hypothetical protein